MQTIATTYNNLKTMTIWNEDSSSEMMVCPGEVAKERLEQFHESWGSEIEEQSGDTKQVYTFADEDFHFGRLIGEGSFGAVTHVFSKSSHWIRSKRCCAESGQAFALKRLKGSVVVNRTMLQIAASDLAMETALLSNLNHDNIITLHGVKSGNMIQSLKEGTFFIVLDLLVETLDVRFDRWRAQRSRYALSPFTRRDTNVTRRIREVAMGIVQGMEYLHSKNVIFR